ncbi:MAG TPA: hypothetical protein DCX14_07490, partial [Flavobacteriales bacterium]|nr:hypothetical protein [Flavobacteriales bacterium]
EVYLQLLDTINLAKTYNNIGIIAEDLGDTKLARKYHSLSLELKLEIGDQNQIASSYIGIGKLYLRLQEWDSASIYFEHAKTVYAQTDNIQGGLWAENNIANAAYYSGDYQKAQRHFKYGLELAIHLKDSTEISRLYANMGWSNISLKQLDDAKSMFDSALFVAQQIESYYALEQAYSGFSDYYIELEDFEKALNFYSKSRDAKDKAMDEKRVEQIATLQTEFSVLEKEKSIAQLAEKNAQAELSLSNQRSWIVGLILALVLIAGGGGIMYLQRQRRVEARLARQELDFRKTMIDATIHAEENERQRIAKDLHDGVVQSLAALKLGVQSAMNAAELESAQKGLFSSHLENIDAAAQEARSISHQMMPRALEEAGLVTALEDMIQKTIGVSDINYSFEHFGFGEQRIDKSIEIGLYRICQELVNNILKHSGANEVFIQLVRTKTHVVLHVEDNGKGFEVKGGKSDGGIGMNNIFSRASAVNGQVSYDSSEPGGTIASIRVPLQELG